jgi:hypothetical protein
MVERQNQASSRRLPRRQSEAQILDAATRVFASKYDLLIATSKRLALESLLQLDSVPAQAL